jgi:hypothetical protein
MGTTLEIIAITSTVITAIPVAALLVWAAIKDGQPDDADARFRLEVQRRENAWRFPDG